MLNVNKLIESARKCMGWPYVSPGSNDSSGIDCSGLFVKMFKDQGAKIAHGSNTIARKYCVFIEPLTDVSQLQRGMAVFKWKEKDTEKYPDGRGDFSHIGIVAGVRPLEIIHASSEAGCVTIDNSIKKWKYCGKLKDVDYSDKGDDPVPEPQPEPEPAPIPEAHYAEVYAENGEPVKLRSKPGSSLYDELPVGTIVEVTGSKGEWTICSYRNRKNWYMKTEFLHFLDGDEPSFDDNDEDLDHGDAPTGFTVMIQGLTEEEADALLKKYPQGTKSCG